MKVWRLNIKPDSAPNVDPRKFCFNRGILGAGWPVDAPSGIDADRYRRLASEKYGSGSWTSFFRAVHQRMDEGDLCWTRDQSGVYYLGQVTGSWRYESGSEHIRADVVNVRNCDWAKIGEADAVPGKILNSFRGRTLQRSRGSTIKAYSGYVYFKHNPAFEYTLTNVEPDLFRLLGPGDCEDVVGAYLQDQGYRLIPSTSKKSTPKYEYVLRGPGGQKAFVQVKQGNVPLNAEDFGQLDGEVYLFSTHGTCITDGYDHVHALDPAEMEAYVYNHLDAMSERIRNWVEIRKHLTD